MDMRILAIESSSTSKGEDEACFIVITTSASSNMVLSNEISGWTVMNLSRSGDKKKENTSSDADTRTEDEGILTKSFPASAQDERIFEAYSMNTFPCPVSTTSPLSLSNSFVPTVFSSSAIFWLTAGWDMPRTAAAFVKLPSSATVVNTFSLKSSNITVDFVQI